MSVAWKLDLRRRSAMLMPLVELWISKLPRRSSAAPASGHGIISERRRLLRHGVRGQCDCKDIVTWHSATGGMRPTGNGRVSIMLVGYR
jgi:hypothetical protein